MPPSRSSRQAPGGVLYVEDGGVLEGKYAEQPERRSMKDDFKQQAYEARAGVKSRAVHLKEQVLDTVDRAKSKAQDLAEQVEPTAYSLRSKAKEFVEEEIRPRARRAKQQIQRAASPESPQEYELDEDVELEDEEDLDEEELPEESGEEEQEHEQGDWGRTLRAKGAELISGARRAGAQLKTRLPELEQKVKKGVSAARSRISRMQQDEGEASEDEDDDQEEEEEPEGGEGNLDLGLIGRRVGTVLRDVRGRLSSGIERAEDKIRGELPATSELRSRLSRGTDRAKELLASKGGEIKDKSRGHLASAARAAENMDWEGTAQKMDEVSRSVKQKALDGARVVRGKVRDLVPSESEGDEDQDLDEEEDIDEGDLDQFERPTSSRLQASPSPEVLRDVDSQIKSNKLARDRKRAVSTPVLIIGSLFALWALASLIGLNNTHLGATNKTSSNWQDGEDIVYSARGSVGHLADKLDHINLDTLRAKTQPIVDAIVGMRKPEPTLGEKVGTWAQGMRESIFGRPEHHYDLRDAGHDLSNGVHKFEDGLYRVVDGVQHRIVPEAEYRIHQASDYAKEHLIPGGRKLAEDAQQKAADMGLIEQPSWGWRLINTLNPFHHEETLLEKTQRLGEQGLDRATELKDRVLHRTVGDRIHDGIDNIKAHIPGLHRNKLDEARDRVQDLAQDARARAEDLAHDAQARAQGLAQDAKDGVDQLTHRSLADKIKDHIPGLHRSKLDQARDVAGDLRDRAADGIDRLRDGVDVDGIKGRVQGVVDDARDGVDQLTHRSLGDKIKAGLHDIKNHIPGMHKTIPEQARDKAYELKDRAADGIDRLRDGIDVDGLKDRAQGLANDARDRAQGLAHDARDKLQDGVDQIPHRSLGDKIKDGLNSLRSHLPGTHQIQDQAGDLKDRVLDRASELKDHAVHDAANLRDRINDNVHDAHLNIPTQRGTLEDALNHGVVPGVDDLHRDIRQGTEAVGQGIHDLEDRLRAHVDPNPSIKEGEHLPREPVPISLVEEEIHSAPGQPTVRQPIGTKLRESIQHGVDKIKAHLPGAGHHASAPVHPAPQQPIQGLHRAGERIVDGAKHVEGQVRDAAGNIIHRGERIVDGARDQLHRIEREIPHSAHDLKKDAEYVAHRVEHTGEKVGHRVEEKYHDVKDRVERRLP